MGTKIGNINISKLMLGNSPVKAYLGSVLVYQSGLYQDVEYIQSDRVNKQYLDLGTTIANTDDFEIKFKFNSVGTTQSFFGARSTTASKVYSLTLTTTSNIEVLDQYSNSYPASVIVSISQGTIYTLKKVGQNIYLDDVLVGTLNETNTFTTVANAFLFTLARQDGTPYAFCDMNIYYFKLIRNNVMIRDLVSCYRRSDSVAGMRDNANNDTFYVNQGSNDDFILGPDVN